MKFIDLDQAPATSAFLSSEETFSKKGPARHPADSNRLLVLAENFEQRLGALYLVFAKRFTRYASLWLTLSEEQNHHANWIHVVAGIIAKESWDLAPDPSLEASITKDCRELEDLIQNHYSRVQRIGQAFEVSVRFELTIGGNRFHDYLKSHPAKVQKLFEDLTTKTRTHVTQLRTASRQRGRFGKLLDDNLITLADLEKAQKVALTSQDAADEFLLTTCRVPKKALLESLSNFFHVPAYEFDPQLRSPSSSWTCC